MLTLKQTLGIVALLAAIIASIVATLRPPSHTTELPAGMLFALTVALCVIAAARLIFSLPNLNRFWAGFLLACLICFFVSLSDRLMSSNTAPEHITRLLTGLAPLDSSVAVHRSNERFYALQGIVINATVLLFATGCGLLSQHRLRADRTGG